MKTAAASKIREGMVTKLATRINPRWFRPARNHRLELLPYAHFKLSPAKGKYEFDCQSPRKSQPIPHPHLYSAAPRTKMYLSAAVAPQISNVASTFIPNFSDAHPPDVAGRP